jgi:hypothetical protein
MSHHLLLSVIYNPYEFEPPHSCGYVITHKDTPQSVGLLWTSDQPVAGTSTWQHTQHLTTNIHAPGGIRIFNRSRWSSADPRLSSATGIGMLHHHLTVTASLFKGREHHNSLIYGCTSYKEWKRKSEVLSPLSIIHLREYPINITDPGRIRVHSTRVRANLIVECPFKLYMCTK